MALTENWKKSSRSGSGGDCVELRLAETPGRVEVRDSKDPDGPTLTFPAGAVAELVSAFRAGQFAS